MRAFTEATLSADDSHDGPHLARSKHGVARSRRPQHRCCRASPATSARRSSPGWHRHSCRPARSCWSHVRSGPSRYGLFAVIVTLTVMVSVIAEWGLPMIAARTIAVGRRGRDEVLAAVLGLRLSLAVVATRRRRRTGVPRVGQRRGAPGRADRIPELPATSLARLCPDPGATRTAPRASRMGDPGRRTVRRRLDARGRGARRGYSPCWRSACS